MTLGVLLSLLLIFLCLILAAFFSATETAITSVSRARLYHLVMEGNARAKIASDLQGQKERLISGLMIGNNSVNIIGASMATELALQNWGEHGVLYVTILMTVIVVVFGEVLPKTYALHHAESLALKLAPVIVLFLRVFHPLNVALHGLVRGLLHVLHLDRGAHDSPGTASEVIRGTIELHHQEGDVVKQDRDMLGSILDMHNVEVGEIMAHRLTMETIDVGLAPDVIISAAIHSPHSRIPFWEGESDNIIGVLHVKTLIMRLRLAPGGTLSNAAIKSLLVPPWFIPETTTIKSQLHAFRAKRQHLALVVDEYGALKGLVTLEDIIEEIVGNIDDEHDREPSNDILQAGPASYVIRGSATIRDVNRELGWNLPDDDASTIAGLVIHEAGSIPAIGETFHYHEMQFTILDKRQNQITRLRVDAPAADAGE